MGHRSCRSRGVRETECFLRTVLCPSRHRPQKTNTAAQVQGYRRTDNAAGPRQSQASRSVLRIACTNIRKEASETLLCCWLFVASRYH